MFLYRLAMDAWERSLRSGTHGKKARKGGAVPTDGGHKKAGKVLKATSSSAMFKGSS